MPRAIYPRESVKIVKGRTESWINRVRTMVICAECGSHLYGEHPDHPYRGANAGNFGPSQFEPSMHLHCRFALAPVGDLLHYLDVPVEYGGTGTLADWQTGRNAGLANCLVAAHKSEAEPVIAGTNCNIAACFGCHLDQNERAIGDRNWPSLSQLNLLNP